MTESAEVPFVKIGERQCLTDKQLVEEPWLRDFVKRFPNSFEYDPKNHAWWWKE